MTQTDNELDEILRTFDGGIHAKGSDKGGYPTYFTEPYPSWLANRKDTVLRLLKSREERLVREARIDAVNTFIADVSNGELDKIIRRGELVLELLPQLRELRKMGKTRRYSMIKRGQDIDAKAEATLNSKENK